MKINHIDYPEQAPGNQGRSMGGYLLTKEEQAKVKAINQANGLQDLVDERNAASGEAYHKIGGAKV